MDPAGVTHLLRLSAFGALLLLILERLWLHDTEVFMVALLWLVVALAAGFRPARD